MYSGNTWLYMFFDSQYTSLLLKSITDQLEKSILVSNRSNTIRLWYPQLAAMIGSNSDKTLCSAIDPTKAPVVSETSCIPIETDMLTYLQSTIVGAGSVLTYGIGSLLINRLVKGQKGVNRSDSESRF